MHFQIIHFENKNGHKLAARLELPPDEKPRAYALFAHCFMCGKNLNAVVNIARALTKQGIAVLRFDFTGLGESEGEFADTTFSSNVDDLVSAARFLTENYAAPKLLIGHSMGGSAVLQAASRISSTAAVATIAAPFRPDPLEDFKGHKHKLEDLESTGETEISITGKSFKLKKQFVDDLEETRMEHTIRNLGKPLIIFHSPQDNVVSLDQGLKIFETAGSPKSFITVEGADHLLSDRTTSQYVGSVLAAWSAKYLGAPQEAPKAKPGDGQVLARTGSVGFQTDIFANEHHLMADEPIPEGGANTGPTPYDLLLAALGSCTTMTLRFYADRKKWPLKSATAHLRHEKVHAEDCQDCENDNSKIDLIQRELELVGPLDESQRKKLIEIADRCPVHRTLTSDIVIKTKLKKWVESED